MPTTRLPCAHVVDSLLPVSKHKFIYRIVYKKSFLSRHYFYYLPIWHQLSKALPNIMRRQQNRRRNVKDGSRPSPKARGAILDGNTRRATAHITNLRRDAFAGTARRAHGLLVLQIMEGLLSDSSRSDSQRRKGNGNWSTVTRPGFTSISGTETASEKCESSG